MKKNVLAILLAFLMTLSLLPMNASGGREGRRSSGRA